VVVLAAVDAHEIDSFVQKGLEFGHGEGLVDGLALIACSFVPDVDLADFTGELEFVGGLLAGLFLFVFQKIVPLRLRSICLANWAVVFDD
jgi:hypothetical protein